VSKVLFIALVTKLLTSTTICSFSFHTYSGNTW